MIGTTSLRKTLFWVFQIATMAWALYFVFCRLIDYSLIASVLSQAQWNWTIPVVLLSLYVRYVMAYQTRILLAQYGVNFSSWFIFRIQMASRFVSFMLPGDLAGSSITWYYFSKENQKRAQVASALVFLRLVNLITIVPVALFAIFFDPDFDPMPIRESLILGSFLLLLAFIPFLSSSAVRVIKVVLDKLLMSWLSWSRGREALRNVVSAVYDCTQMPARYKLVAIFSSFFIHLLSIVSTWFLCLMISLPISIVALLLIRSIVLVLTTFPLIMGGTGVRELTLVYILQSVYSIEPTQTVVFSMLLFATTVLTSVLPGIFFMTSLKLQTQQKATVS